MRIILLIGTGSFIGGILRYLTSQLIQNRVSIAFPYGTFWVNLIGCLLIGILFGLSEKGNLDPNWRFFLVTGLCGGYTTFSAFSIDSVSLFRDGQLLYGFLYISGTVFLGLLATLTGIALIKLL
jgi:fluoride exporter